MTEGSVAEWKRADGDHVNAGDVIAIVETDKLTNNLEAPATGTLRVTVEAGVEVPVAGKLGYIEIEDE
ncbi:MAG: biotin/lipoyl-binding protein [Aeriscardovia sp.]|nr:biotin/lipoyl-binding protein [Aeriscardovia sp.]